MENENQQSNEQSWGVVAFIVALIVFGLLAWFFYPKQTEPEPVVEPIVQVEPEIVEQPEKVEVQEVEEQLPELEETPQAPPAIEEKPELPQLEESDNWVIEKLPELTWREELTKLLITEDMIRRFVVFTDNFAQGELAYAHSPVVVPEGDFSATEIDTQGTEQDTWGWNDNSTKRFAVYVDLLRSLDTDTLVTLYQDLKPLIDQAYAELGYPDDEFTDVLQQAIDKVLDMQYPTGRYSFVSSKRYVQVQR